MALTQADRRKVWAGVMRVWSARGESMGFVKADLASAIDAVDQWIDDNAASYNAAIPEVVRTALTPGQKAELLYAVAMKRTGRPVEQEG
jgi:hypothetical protein